MRLLAACVVLCAAAHAQLTVDEHATRARLVDGATAVSVALQNSFARSVDIRVQLEWIDTKDQLRQRAQLTRTVPAGHSTIDAALPIHDGNDALFYRLRYLVSPAAANLSAFGPITGILSFPQIA